MTFERNLYIREVIIRGEMKFTIINIIERGNTNGFPDMEKMARLPLYVCRKEVNNKSTIVTLKESVLLGLERYSEFDAVRDR